MKNAAGTRLRLGQLCWPPFLQPVTHLTGTQDHLADCCITAVPESHCRTTAARCFSTLHSHYKAPRPPYRGKRMSFSALMLDGDMKIVSGHIIEVDFHIRAMVPTVLLCFGKVICAYLISHASMIAFGD